MPSAVSTSRRWPTWYSPEGVIPVLMRCWVWVCRSSCATASAQCCGRVSLMRLSLFASHWGMISVIVTNYDGIGVFLQSLFEKSQILRSRWWEDKGDGKAEAFSSLSHRERAGGEGP